MKALRIDTPGVIALHDEPFDPQPHECAVRVAAAGICGTDLQLLAGYADFTGIPGHEFVGVVEDAPANDRHLIGRRVVGEINVGCGTCDWCRQGVKEHCPARTVVGIRGRAGAFAERIALPAANLHVLPDAISDRAGVFVEPVAAACRILEQVRITPESRVAIVGDGRLGLLVAQVLRTAAGRVIVFGRHAQKLDVARALALEVADTDISAATSFDVVVDATGRPAGLARAMDLVRPRGTLVLKSTFHGEAGVPLWPLAVHEVTVVGSRCGPFARAIELLAAGAVRVEPMIEEMRPLEEYDAAFGAARRALKVLFDIGGVG